MSTKEINLGYEQKIKNFLLLQSLLKDPNFRFSFEMVDLEYSNNKAKVDVIFNNALSLRHYFLILISNNKITQPIPKNLDNFNMGLEFDKNSEGHFISKTHQKLYYAISDNKKEKGEKLRRFWDTLMIKLSKVLYVEKG